MKVFSLNKVTGGAFVALGSFWIIYGRDYPLLNRLGRPGVGMFPFLVASLMIIFGVVLILMNLKENESLSKLRFHKGSAAILIVYIATAMVWETVGTIIALSGMLFVIWIFYEKMSWSKSLVLAVTVTIAFYSLFRLALNVPLPRGWIGF